MMTRWRAAASAAGEGQSAAPAAAGRPGLGARLQRLLRFATEPDAGAQAARRRRLFTALLIVYLVALVAGSLAYNVPLLSQQSAMRAQAERETLRVASMQRLTANVDEERAKAAKLVIERAQRYRRLPGEADLPVAIEQVRRLPALSGGEARGVDNSPPRWSGNSGQLQTHATFYGTWPEALAYIAAMNGLLPESTLERLTVRFDGPGRVVADVLLTAAAARERPEDVPAWDGDAAWRRAEAAVADVHPAGSPFMPGALLWYEGRAAGMALPELRLAGLARQQDGDVLALLVYGGESRLVRPGSRVGDIEVMAIDDEGAVIAIGGRTFKLQVGKAPQAWR